MSGAAIYFLNKTLDTAAVRKNLLASAEKESFSWQFGDIFYTKKGKDLYVICSQWPDQITIKGISNPKNISMLGYKGKIKTSQSKGKIVITAPVITPRTLPCNSAWVYKIEGVL